MTSIKERWADSNTEFVWITPCMNCKHRKGPWTCKAFPDGIPEQILVGKHDHKTPFPGDNGIQWEQK